MSAPYPCESTFLAKCIASGAPGTRAATLHPRFQDRSRPAS